MGSADGGSGQPGPSCQAGCDTAGIAQLRAEVSELSRSVLAIREVVAEAAGGGSPGPGKGGEVAHVFPPGGPAWRGRAASAWRPGEAPAPGLRAGRGSPGGVMTPARDSAASSGRTGWQGRGQGPSWGRTSPGMADGGRNRAICWTCGEAGHIQRFCTRAPLARGRGRSSPVVCWRCREFGHT